MNSPITALVLLALAASNDEFARFPAEANLVGPAKRPVARSQMARTYRTVLRQAAEEGPDFNGHYKIARWGCGTNCVLWAVINLQTGEVWASEKPLSSCYVPGEAEDEDTAPEAIVARKDSRLIYVHVCTNLDGSRILDTRKVFEWTGHAPKLLRTEPLVESQKP